MTGHGVVPGDRASYLTSLPYHLAIAAHEPDAEFDIGSSPVSSPEPVMALMQKVSVTGDDALLAHYPATWPARIVVRTADGDHDRLVLNVPGDPARPMSNGELAAKFHRFVGAAAGIGAAQTLYSNCNSVLNSRAGSGELVAQIETLM